MSMPEMDMRLACESVRRNCLRSGLPLRCARDLGDGDADGSSSMAGCERGGMRVAVEVSIASSSEDGPGKESD